MNKSIKILYLLNASSKHAGSSKSFFLMLKELIDKGVCPLVILPVDGDMSDLLRRHNINCEIISYYHYVYPRFSNFHEILIFIPRFIRLLIINCIAFIKLIKITNNFKPNIIHTNVGPIHVGYMIARLLHLPHVWHIREYQDKDFNMHPLFSMNNFKNRLLTKNNYPITITLKLKDYFSLNEDTSVIYNGILKSSSSKFLLKKENYFLFAGRLEKNKGIEDLIHSFIDFTKNQKNFQLLIAGDTTDNEYKKYLLEVVYKANINDLVSFLGVRDDLNILMQNATALIVPSINEGFGRITAEAMFNGCLVIGRNCAGTQEILEKNNLGVLYNKTDELINSMQIVIEKGITSYFPMIKKAQDEAVSLYSQEKNGQLVYNLYNKIIKVSDFISL